MTKKIVISAVNIRKEYVVKKHLFTGKIKEKYVAVKGAAFGTVLRLLRQDIYSLWLNQGLLLKAFYR